MTLTPGEVGSDLCHNRPGRTSLGAEGGAGTGRTLEGDPGVAGHQDGMGACRRGEGVVLEAGAWGRGLVACLDIRASGT
jgi:hypothetical protein